MSTVETKKKNSRLLMIIAAAIVILIGLGMYVNAKHQSKPALGAQALQINGTLLPEAKAISPFQLTTDDNKSFNNDSLKQRWTLMFFGFTRCGDVCPGTLTELNKMYQQLEKTLPATSLPQVIMVTVDPDRDTLDQMGHYVKNFNPNFLGATAAPNTLETFNKDMGVFYSKVQKGNDYGMHHSSQLFIFNPEGRWIGFFSYPNKSQQMIQDYLKIINTQNLSQ